MKEIPSLKGIFINEDGTVIYSEKLKRNLLIGKMVKHYKTRDYVQNLVNVNQKSYCVSRLVYETYIGSIPEGMCIDHIDNNPQNNHWSNLQALSRSENSKKCFRDDPTLRDRIRDAVHQMRQIGYVKKSNGVKNPHKQFYCIETKDVFNTLHEASEHFNISINKIFRNLKRKQSTGIGVNFDYVG